jgi:translocator protein
MNKASTWYSTLIKPSFAPPQWLFGPAWTILYSIIAVTFIRIFYLTAQNSLPFSATVPFILNLICNLSYSPLQFSLKNNYLAAVDAILVFGTLVWAIIAIWPYSHALAYAQAPYLLWVSFAVVLQLTIAWLNR